MHILKQSWEQVPLANFGAAVISNLMSILLFRPSVFTNLMFRPPETLKISCELHQNQGETNFAGMFSSCVQTTSGLPKLHQSSITAFFNQINISPTHCVPTSSTVIGLIIAMGTSYVPLEWRLFIDSSKKRPYCVLLHNGNKLASMPIDYSVKKKERKHTKTSWQNRICRAWMGKMWRL